jgi:hypothetical protein
MAKVFLFTDNDQHFYEDMTYRCSHWKPDDYSQWKIEDGRFWFNHCEGTGGAGWQVSTRTNDDKRIVHLQTMYNDAITKMMEEAFNLGEE